MKKIGFALLGLTVLLACAPAGAAAPRRSDRPQISGPSYVRLGDWARANKFAVRQVDRDTLLLSNRWTRLAFNTDPRQDLRKAQVNGVAVWLAFPLALRNGGAYISQTDLEETLGPVFRPPVNRPGIAVKTICLDPGHGGKDPGNRVGSHEEQKYTLLLAQELREQLRAAGFKVVLTRATDASVDRSARPELARRTGADLFVSLHFNSYDGASRNEVKGAETYCCTPAGATSFNAGGEGDRRWVAGNRHGDRNLLLAYHVQKAIVKNLPVEDRGVRRARFQVLREATMPAVLVEGGFMSNPAEGRKIFDPTYRRQLAKAIAEGIIAYKRAVKG